MHQMEYLKDRNHLAIISLLIVGLLYVFFSWTPAGANNLFFAVQEQMLHSPNNNNNNNNNENVVAMKSRREKEYYKKDELKEVLAETVTANKMVIITMVNRAYVEGDKPMLDLFLDSLWLGDHTRPLLDHLLLVATDETSFQRCKFLRLHCYKIDLSHSQDKDKDKDEADGDRTVEEEHVYMSPGFVNMMWRRTQFLGDVLKRGYSFIFSDTDIMWLRDPFPRLSSDESLDLQISTDGFNGNPWSEANAINTGFYMIRSNNNTIKLLDMWYERRTTSNGMKEQDVLQRMIREGVVRELGVRVKFLDTLFFSGFCNDSRDVRLVCTVHANCCRFIKAKVSDLLQVLHDWKRFLSLPPPSPTNDTRTHHHTRTARFRWSKHVACENSWK